MREGTFHEECEVELSEDERNLRGRQAARQKVALDAHRERAKAAKKKLTEEEERIEEALKKASLAAETGREMREVECREELRGIMVEVIRLDTFETVGEPRRATPFELAGEDEPAGPKGKKKPKDDETDARPRH